MTKPGVSVSNSEHVAGATVVARDEVTTQVAAEAQVITVSVDLGLAD